jgi:hypothetical protein
MMGFCGRRHLTKRLSFVGMRSDGAASKGAGIAVTLFVAILPRKCFFIRRSF